MRKFFPSHIFALLITMIVLEQQRLVSPNTFSWMWRDHFDELDEHMASVSAQNCLAKSQKELLLRSDTVSQLPVYNKLLNRIWYKNRTKLIHLHNMALNRAFFYSFILQRLNSSSSFHLQPSWMYMYMSVTADVNANPDTLNGSALYFDTDCHYPNWYQTVPFNKTLKLFGPKAWRHDDTLDQGNILREPSRTVVRVADIAAGTSGNYTHPSFKMNPWYEKWLPDVKGDMDSVTKFTYYVGIKHSNQTGSFTTDNFEDFSFFGPASPSAEDKDPRKLPVAWTQPYFDCQRYNNWVVSAVSPVVDFMPRYTEWIHLRRQRFCAVTVMDMAFKKIDFNACDVGKGNPGPSYLSNIHRCKPGTTCKHKMGKGFKRGAYWCPCKSGHKYPWSEQQPYDGKVMEQATREEYEEGFMCTPSQFLQVLPKLDQTEGINIMDSLEMLASGGLGDGHETPILASNKAGPHPRSLRSSNVSQYMQMPAEEMLIQKRMHTGVERVLEEQLQEPIRQKKSGQTTLKLPHDLRWRIPEKPISSSYSELDVRKKREIHSDPQALDRMMRIFRQSEVITSDNCHRVAKHNLVMPGDVAFGVKAQFENEAMTAVRLSHFLSNFLQNTHPEENFGNLRGGGTLHEEHMFAEVVANVLSNHKIYSSGIFFEPYTWENSDRSKKELFGPWSFRRHGKTFALDTAGTAHRYTEEAFYHDVKMRWATNSKGLKSFKMSATIRSDPEGTSSIKHEYYPMKYRAPDYIAGHWSNPFFRCDGMVDAWVITYTVPFFGMDSAKRRLKFMGVITIDIPLNLLEVNPCPMGFGVANAFKNTAHCDHFSTKCGVISGYPFTRGAYSCKCRQGFEYPHYDGREWFQGSLVEGEYEKKLRGMFSRFDQLYCRVAAAMFLKTSNQLLIALLLSVEVMSRWISLITM